MTGIIAKVLLTALDHTYHFPFFNPSRRDVRDLYDALEDLVLPMGSFPSEHLHPWAPTDLIYGSNPTTSPLSTLPSPGSIRSKHDGESPPPKPTLGDGGVKHLSITPPTKSTLRNARPKSTVMRSSALPIRNDSVSAPGTNSTSTGRSPIGGQSNAAVMSALVTSTPSDDASTPADKLPRTGQSTSDPRLTTSTLPPPIKLTPKNGRISDSEGSPDEPFDSLDFQQVPEYNSCNAGSAVEVPLPEQTVAETSAFGRGSITLAEEGQEEQQDEDSTAAVKEVSTGTQTTEQQDGNSTAAVEKVSTGTLALFENAVRKLVDPEGTSGADLQKLVQLVADIMKQRTEAEESLRSETVRSKRAEEDLRHWWEDMRGVFERIISGQNTTLQWTRDESHELTEENRKLKLEHSVDEDKRKDLLEGYNARLRTLKGEKNFAEETAKTATAEAEDRINVMRDNYENAKLAAEDKHMHERNSLITSRRMVRNDLNGARRQLTVAVEEHQVEIKDKDRTIQGLEATIRQIRSTVTASEELAASDKRHLEKQLEDQRKEKDGEIGTLTEQLRESKAVVKSLSGWKDTAEAEKRNRIRLSERLEDETTRLREDKKHIVDQKNLDIRGLERTIKTNEADISRLGAMITSLEAGEEMLGLKSQLEESKKQLRVSAKNMQDMKQQLQNCQRESEELKSTIKARDKNISEEAEKASKEKGDLKKQLEQTTRVFEEGLEEKVRELKEQKDDLARKLEIAQNAEQTVRTGMQRHHDENGQTAAEHEKMIKEMNEEIHRLQLNEQNYENHKKTAVENAVGKIIEEAKGKIGELERDKAAIEKAAKEAAESVRQTLQKQLDDERQSFREAQEKATMTENELRNEMGVLKSQVNSVEKSHSIGPAGPDPGKEAQIVEELAKQVNDANNLLLEIGANGVAKKSVEQTVLCQLNDAKIALHRVKGVLLDTPARYHRARLVKVIDGVNVNEERIAQLPIDSALVSQAKMANARLRKLEKILDANADVQRDAMLEALHTPTPFEREIRKPRALRRPAKPSPPSNPSTDGQTEVSMGQFQQTKGAPEQQYNPHFSNLYQNAQPQTQAATSQNQIPDFAQIQSGGPMTGAVSQPDTFDFMSVRSAPAASDNPLLQPLAMVDAGAGGPSMPKNNTQNGVSANRPTVIKRDHRQPFMDLLASLKPAADNNVSGARPVANAPSPVTSLQSDHHASVSVEKSKNDHENRIPEMPVGWTDEMTGTVRAMHGEDNVFIEEMVKELHGLQVKDAKGLENWLKKLQSDHEVEMNPNLDPALGGFPPNA